ncbi:MAG: aspartate kinase [Oscillospiraceae bacterium]|nr:aspartate kinase [Oscillospiraceae bacterium]
MLKVLKFGGTSMADANQYKKIKDIVFSDPTRRVIVVSAAGKRFPKDNKITDLLYLCHAHLQYGVSYETIFDMIRERYVSIRDELGLSRRIEAELEILRDKMDRGISQEELVSRGEYLSAILMADYLGFPFVDAADWLYFRNDGTIDQVRSYSTLRNIVRDGRAVIPGFYGLMPDGKIRTLTRGGSDITGALAAAALDADVYENWTDVPGILMADPTIVETPRTIERATYSELRQLSYSGAKVLHEMTVFPVRDKNIPLNIRNTNDPENPGTMVCEEFKDSSADRRQFITGIAGKKDYTAVTIHKKGMSSAVGTLKTMAEIFENNTVPIYYTPSGIDCITMVCPTEHLTPHIYSVMNDLSREMRPDDIKVIDNIAIIAVVGRRMAYRTGTAGRIFSALGEAKINIRLISQGPEEMNILVGVDHKDYDEAIRVLYNAFAK